MEPPSTEQLRTMVDDALTTIQGIRTGDGRVLDHIPSEDIARIRAQIAETILKAFRSGTTAEIPDILEIRSDG